MTPDLNEPRVVFHTTEAQDMEGRPVALTMLELPAGDFQVVIYQDGIEEVLWPMTRDEAREFGQMIVKTCQSMLDESEAES